MSSKIRLTYADGLPVFIEPDWIARIEIHSDGQTCVVNKGPIGNYWKVTETPEEIAALIAAKREETQ